METTDARIRLPIGTLITPGFVTAFRRLCQAPLPAPTAYALKRTHDQIVGESAAAEAARVACVKRHGRETGEQGWAVDPATPGHQAFLAEMAEFRKTEVELFLNRRIQLADLGDFKISAAELEALEPLLEL